MADVNAQPAAAPQSYSPKFRPEHICQLPRHQALSKLRKYYNGTQYDGRPDWWTGRKGSEEVPLRERKPCVIYPLPKGATNQVVRFTFGERRFPTIGVDVTEADGLIPGVSEQDAEVLEDFISELVDRSRLKPGMRRIMRPGLSTGTACVILALKRGVFTLQLANAEDVLPKFKDDDPSNDVEALTWCYQYDQSVPGAKGPEKKRFWYRQDVTAEAFIEYAPVEFVPNRTPIWTVSKTTAHGFGFCPAIWIRNLTEEDSADVDGVSLYAGQFEEFDALNFTLSQRHRGVHHLGTPQPWETGVEGDDGPKETGRTSVGTAGYTGSEEKPPHGAVAKRARPGGPGITWRYRGQNVKLGLLETTGKAFEVATLHVNDIRSRILEAMSVVLVNAQDIFGRSSQGQMSAKYLELAYEPLLALVDEMRHLWWFDGLYRILGAMLRIVATFDAKRILIPGAAKVQAILKRFMVTTDEGPLWLPPKLTPSWGDYFSAGPEEIKQAIDAAASALESHLVPEEDAVKFVAPHFGREDIPEMLEAIREEKEAAMAIAHELAGAAEDEDPDGEGGQAPGGPGKGTGGNPPKDAGGGSGDAAPAAKKPSGGKPADEAGPRPRAVRRRPARGGKKRR